MKINKILIFFIALILIVCCVFFNCSKDSPSEPEDNTPKQITDIEGNWVGKTSQNENISFDVKSLADGHNKVTHYKITVNLGTYTQSSESWGDWSVAKDKHNFMIYSFSPYYIYIYGVFKSNDECDGSFTYESIEGKWTATKQ